MYLQCHGYLAKEFVNASTCAELHQLLFSFREPSSTTRPTENGAEETPATSGAASMTNGDSNFVEENSNPVPDAADNSNLIGCR